MSRLARAAWWLAVVAGTLLVYFPVAGALQLGQLDETLALLTLSSTLGGLAIAATAFGRKTEAPLKALAAGALMGGALAVATQPLLLPFAGAGAARPPQRFILTALMESAGALLVVAGIRRLASPDKRIAAFVALVLSVIVLLGPGLASASTIEAHHLAELDIRSIQLYWTIGSVILVLPAVALTTLPGDWFERWWSIAESRVMAVPNRTFAIGLFGVTLALAIGFWIYCFSGHPTTADEIVQLWHAKILLSGRLSLPPDPNAEFFSIDNMIDHPRWYSQFPIGGPAFLVPGVAIGLPGLINPILTALTALNVYRFGQRAYGEGQARAAAVLFVASPMVLIMGGSQMNHTPTAWLVSIALAALPFWIDAATPRDRLRSGALIGLAVGLAATIRPLDAVIVTAVIGIVMLDAARTQPDRAMSMLAATACGAVPVTLLLVANWRTTGGPLTWGYQVLWGPNHSLGLHPDPLGVPHTAGRALLLGLRYAMQVNWSVTSWPLPVLLIIAVAFAAARRLQRWDAVLLAYCAAQLVAYAFYWHNGQFAGPRFLFPAVPALLVLAARAPFIIAERVRGTWRRATLVLVPVCVAASWLRPMEPYGVRGIASNFHLTRQELKRDTPPDTLMRKLPRALVFVQEGPGSRLARRLWALGISHQDAARFIDVGDACSILEAVRAEEKRGLADTVGRMERMEQSIALYDPSGAGLGPAREVSFKINGASVMTPACTFEIAHDRRIASVIAYGPLLLHNEFDALGRITGQVIYVIDLGERNEILRSRFGDRQWFRWEIPQQTRDTQPVLVPYDAGVLRALP